MQADKMKVKVCIQLLFLVGVGVATSAGRLENVRKATSAGRFEKFINATNLLEQGCNPTPLIKRHEGFKACMYIDTKGIKSIGIGYNLQRPQARREIGADYDKIVNGPSTKSTVKCNCRSVVCLNDAKIVALFQGDLQTAVRGAQGALPGLNSYCCQVYNNIVDMAFNLGGRGLSQFTQFLGYLKAYNWKAAADDLLTTLYCNGRGQPIGRCRETSQALRQGCPCSGQMKLCPDGSACCPMGTSCCKVKVHFPGVAPRDEIETVCKKQC